MQHSCMIPRCPALIAKGKRYCPQHTIEAAQHDVQRRGTASERGYGRDWQEASRPYLKAHPHCERCMDERRGQVKATLVGHRVALRDGGERLNPANWIALCVSCNTKQAHDDRAYGIANTTPGGGREKTSPQTRKDRGAGGFLCLRDGVFQLFLTRTSR